MTQVHFLKKAALLSGVALISFVATAQAGFEWKGPLEAPRPAAEAAAPEAAPDAATSDAAGMSPAPAQQDLAPVTSWSNDMPAPPPVAQPMSAPAEAAAAATGDTLTGFGADLPLVIALQQVVPAGYQYSFSGGVNPGVAVSWQGGKAWQQVLADMLAPAGLGYTLQNNAVIIGHFTPGASVRPAAMTAPAATPLPEATDTTMTPMPDDNAPAAATSSDTAPVALSGAPSDAAASEPAPTSWNAPGADAQKSGAPVSIRREKPSSLLERLGWTRRDDNTEGANTAVPPSAGMSSEPAPAAKPAETSAAPAVEPSPVSEPVQMAAAETAQPAPAAASTAVPAVTGSWAGTKGQTLRDVLKAWADKAGVELYWSIDYDYRLSDDVAMTGTFDEAVGGLLDKFSTVRPQPYGQLHQSSSGPRVLVVKSYDLTR